MTSAEIREFKVELLDDVYELATEPVSDVEEVKTRIEAFFARLEESVGEER